MTEKNQFNLGLLPEIKSSLSNTVPYSPKSLLSTTSKFNLSFNKPQHLSPIKNPSKSSRSRHSKANSISFFKKTNHTLTNFLIDKANNMKTEIQHQIRGNSPHPNTSQDPNKKHTNKGEAQNQEEISYTQVQKHKWKKERKKILQKLLHTKLERISGQEPPHYTTLTPVCQDGPSKATYFKTQDNFFPSKATTRINKLHLLALKKPHTQPLTPTPEQNKHYNQNTPQNDLNLNSNTNTNKLNYRLNKLNKFNKLNVSNSYNIAGKQDNLTLREIGDGQNGGFKNRSVSGSKYKGFNYNAGRSDAAFQGSLVCGLCWRCAEKINNQDLELNRFFITNEEEVKYAIEETLQNLDNMSVSTGVSGLSRASQTARGYGENELVALEQEGNRPVFCVRCLYEIFQKKQEKVEVEKKIRFLSNSPHNVDFVKNKGEIKVKQRLDNFKKDTFESAEKVENKDRQNTCRIKIDERIDSGERKNVPLSLRHKRDSSLKIEKPQLRQNISNALRKIHQFEEYDTKNMAHVRNYDHVTTNQAMFKIENENKIDRKHFKRNNLVNTFADAQFSGGIFNKPFFI